MPARCLFVGGTASHVGKSWFVTAMGAWLRRRGISVAPFKAQNMSNNSYPCIDGGEIGRAQVVQAWACGLEPETAMNPILLKPAGDSRCQVVVRGKVWKTVSAREYYQHCEALREEVLRAWSELAARYEFLLIEGAGSVAEVNLQPFDLVNFGFARRVGAPALLVADIDRGGVFASLLGTLQLLAAEDRRLVRSFAINRFRGDRSLFDEGKRYLEAASGLPCLGVFPFLDDVVLEAEDSLSVPPVTETIPPEATCAIVRLPRISNSTDFELLEGAVWIDRPVPQRFHTIVLPGTKNTIADLRWLKQRGLDHWIRAQHRAGSQVVGICGGYQMLGRRVEDPLGIEGPPTTEPGLDLLPVVTTMAPDKQVRRRIGRTAEGLRVEGYEIHMGVTVPAEPLPALFTLEDGAPEGVRLPGVVATYLHGALRSAEFVRRVLGLAARLAPAFDEIANRLADWFEEHNCGFEKIYLSGSGGRMVCQ